MNGVAGCLTPSNLMVPVTPAAVPIQPPRVEEHPEARQPFRPFGSRLGERPAEADRSSVLDRDPVLSQNWIERG
jgi:hypothetical protein